MTIRSRFERRPTHLSHGPFSLRSSERAEHDHSQQYHLTNEPASQPYASRPQFRPSQITRSATHSAALKQQGLSIDNGRRPVNQSLALHSPPQAHDTRRRRQDHSPRPMPLPCLEHPMMLHVRRPHYRQPFRVCPESPASAPSTASAVQARVQRAKHPLRPKLWGSSLGIAVRGTDGAKSARGSKESGWG